MSQLLRSGASLQPKQLLQRSDVRHHVSKLLYANEWAKSIEESHPMSEARTVTLAKHWEDVAKIKQALHGVHDKLLPVLHNKQTYNEVMSGTQTAWF